MKYQDISETIIEQCLKNNIVHFNFLMYNYVIGKE